VAEQRIGLRPRQISVGPDSPVAAEPPTAPGAASPPGAAADASAAVTALYHATALGLVRLAHVMIGDRSAAEDIVQDAFYGLYRRWDYLSDQDKAQAYLRSCVLNACRSALRRSRAKAGPLDAISGTGEQASGEAAALLEDERKAVMAALRRLPHRQREVLVLRFYLDLTDAQIAAQMGIGQSTVRSAAHRALAAVGRMLRESP
jgi:RNA polymerase sigma-70 factor (sigma-E family)